MCYFIINIVQFLLFSPSVTLHRLADNDQPLVMCLGWTAEGLNNHKFVLQDNDTEEIMVSNYKD